MPRLGVVLPCVLALVACNKPAGPPSGSVSAPEAGAAPAASQHAADELRAGDRAVWQGACANFVRSIQKELATLPSACKADGDCTCYVGGIEAVTGCGGVSDLATAQRIGTHQWSFNTGQCSYGVDCAPRLCRAACVQGRCKEASGPAGP